MASEMVERIRRERQQAAIAAAGKAVKPEDLARLAEERAKADIQALYDTGHLVAEINGHRIVIFPDGEAKAWKVGTVIAPVMPEAGKICPSCGGSSFLIGPNLTRRCYLCQPLPDLARRNAQVIGQRIIERRG